MWHVYLDEIQLIDNYEVSQQALQCLVDLANAWLLEMAHNTILFGNNWNTILEQDLFYSAYIW
jgi:hypothetical protein